MTPEGKVKAKVKKWLQARGWFYIMPVSNGMGRHGVHDFICGRPTVITPDMVGQRVALLRTIETKAEGKLTNLTEQQKDFGAEVDAAGGKWLVVDNVSSLDEEWP